jgi:hypothetical protein
MMSDTPNLQALVGHEVGIMSRHIDPNKPLFTAQLRGVEPSGLWLESQSLTETVLAILGEKSFPATPVFFFPFHMIEFVFSLIDIPSISDTLAE